MSPLLFLDLRGDMLELGRRLPLPPLLLLPKLALKLAPRLVVVAVPLLLPKLFLDGLPSSFPMVPNFEEVEEAAAAAAAATLLLFLLPSNNDDLSLLLLLIDC